MNKVYLCVVIVTNNVKFNNTVNVFYWAKSFATEHGVVHVVEDPVPVEGDLAVDPEHPLLPALLPVAGDPRQDVSPLGQSAQGQWSARVSLQ